MMSEHCRWFVAVICVASWENSPVAAQGQQPHPEVIKNSIGMKLTLVPAGEFTMGSSETVSELAKQFPNIKPEQFADEHPQHKVSITKPFYLGTYEVTLGQFREFRDDTNYKCDCEKDGKGGWGWTGEKFEQQPKFTPWDWGFDGQSNSHPVVNVSWNDATAFCKWLSKKEGKTYRLPTEAEWEYGARGGTTTRYYHGNDPEGLAAYENVRDGTSQEKINWTDKGISARDGFAWTAPIGSFRPNAFGLYDMLGNAAEWCGDWYGEDYYSTSPAEDPKGPDSGSFRVIRGGSWCNLPVYCRSSYRSADAPANRGSYVGFRVVCER